jgi:iron complex outermembrane receptor protein
MHLRAALLSGIALLLTVSPALAQDDYHSEASQEIVVTGVFQRSQTDILSGTSVLAGTELVRNLKPTIGDTLTSQPGVSATSFGPNASRPVLRGFQGERVRVLTDGIGSFDVSNTSVDHAVVINPLTADRIEVLRGPSALLFGSAAIGGVINVFDSRIPREIPDEPVHLDSILTYGSAANERSAAGEVEVPLGGGLVVHLDGSYSKTGNLRTGGHILTPALRAEAAESDEAEVAELATLRGKLPNSESERWEVAGGLALVTDGGSLGFSVEHTDNLYGVPPRYVLEHHDEAEGAEEEHSHEQVRIDMRQTRADLRGEILPASGAFQAIRLRAGFADYRHNELEESGEIGTRFFNKSIESRLELVQARKGEWEGAVGAQMFVRDFRVIGEEKFLPENETQQFGLFTLQSLDMGAFRAEAGARVERSILTADADDDLGTAALGRRFTTVSGSLGGSIQAGEGWRAGLSLSHTQRAPSAEELFAAGPHLGTQSFEIGEPALDKEKSWGLEASLHGRGERYSFSLSAYHSWFSNYIYQEMTGAEVDELPVFQYRQGKARYYGFEAEGSVRLVQIGGYAINLDALADYVRARISNVGPAPRIPPLRLLAGIEAQGERLQGRLEVEQVFDQKRIAVNETATDDYMLVNASLSFKPFADNGTSIMLSANNIFDVVARRHASLLKDYAPLPGRDIRVSARFTF